MPTHDPCAGCGAPLDEHQRYCVRCGESRRHPDDPVARYLLQRRRPEPAAAAVPVAIARSRTDGRLVALALAMLPAAAAAGVLVGNDGGAAPDKALVAALKQQGTRAAQPVAAATPAAAAAVADTAASGPVTSDFTAARGFVVRLKALPGGTDAAAVAAAKKAAKRHGATKVGVLVTKDFTLKPAVKAPFMVYSGPYPTRTAADAARSKLAKAYPGAQVVAVKTPSSGGVHAARAAKIAAEDAVVRKHPTQQQETQGGQIVKQIQAKQGKSYVEQQQQLPDTIVVP